MTEMKPTSEPAGNASPVTTASAQPATHDRTFTVARDAAVVLRAPIDALRGVLPDSPVPIALGAGALALGGVIEWPVAGAIGLGYLAVRRWQPHAPQAGSA